jgi:oxygen-independent coproporphyrinogen-3 oxidase
VAGRDDLVERYFAALEKECERIVAPLEIETLYVGGGTPSHLGPAGLRRLFRLVQARCVFVPGGEVTVEANPHDVTAEFVRAALECGVSRISLGSQSLDAATLRSLDRDHAPDDVRRATGLLRRAGLTINLDLMTAAPGQSLASVEKDLEAVLALAPEHVSVYCLTWEKGTAFEAARQRGKLSRVPDEVERTMFETAIDRLEAGGYEHYEVSNFARPGFRCRHNEAYWDLRSWEAVGPGAARFDGRTRITNHRSTTTWMNKVLAGDHATGDVDAMTSEQAARERLVVGLRRRVGMGRTDFRSASGHDLDRIAGPAVARWVAAGLATDDGHTVRLTRAGLLVSDTLWAEVL